MPVARLCVDCVCQERQNKLVNGTDSPFCKQAETVLLPELSSPSNRRVIFLHTKTVLMKTLTAKSNCNDRSLSSRSCISGATNTSTK